MKKICFLIASAIFINFCSAQVAGDTVMVKGADGMQKVYLQVEREAQFKGGEVAWKRYLQGNFEIEKVTKKMKIKKTPHTEVAIVKFIVSKTGELSDVEVENKVHSAFAKEAIRLIEESPRWIPANQYGKPVNAYRRQPITIEITSEKAD